MDGCAASSHPCCVPTHPAQELAELYHQRWEIELGFREVKQTLQEGEPVLRSKQPALVRQELWGVLIAYTHCCAAGCARWQRTSGRAPARSICSQLRHRERYWRSPAWTLARI